MQKDTPGLTVTGFEKRHQRVAPRHVFMTRMARAVGLWLAITAFGLVIGIAGYAGFEGMSLTDSFLNAAMILSGMGPLDPMPTKAGEIFEGAYALASGLLFFAVAGFALAPALHHVLRGFHLEDEEAKQNARPPTKH